MKSTQGGAFFRAVFKSIIFMSMINGAEGSMDPGFQELRRGWILHRAEEVAIIQAVQCLYNIASKFQEEARVAYNANQFNGNSRLYGASGQILKAADQFQLITINAIRNKTKCQACHRWLQG